MSEQQAIPDVGAEQISPEFGQKIASYIQTTDELITELRNENAQLKAGTQKQASEGAVEENRVTEVIDHLIQAGFLKESSRDQALEAMKADPANAMLDFVDKLASQRIASSQQQLPALGHAVAKPGQESDAAPNSSGEKRASDKSFEATFDHLSTS